MKRLMTIFGHPIILMIFLVSVLFVILNAYNLDNPGNKFDHVLFYFITGISGITSLFMAIRTPWRDWTFLGAGLLGHFLAVGLVYFLSVWYSSHPIETYTPELLVLARAMLIVSGALVLNGILKEWLEDLGFYAPDVLKRVRHPLYSYQRWRQKGKVNTNKD